MDSLIVMQLLHAAAPAGPAISRHGQPSPVTVETVETAARAPHSARERPPHVPRAATAQRQRHFCCYTGSSRPALKPGEGAWEQR